MTRTRTSRTARIGAFIATAVIGVLVARRMSKSPPARSEPAGYDAILQRLDRIDAHLSQPKKGPHSARKKLLTILTVCAVAFSAPMLLIYLTEFAGTRPDNASDRPGAVIHFPVAVSYISFIITPESTRVEVKFARPEKVEVIEMRRSTEQPQVEVRNIMGISNYQGDGRDSNWKVENGGDRRLVIRHESRLLLSAISFELFGNSIVDVAEKRYVRTPAWLLQAASYDEAYSDDLLNKGSFDLPTVGYVVEKIESSTRLTTGGDTTGDGGPSVAGQQEIEGGSTSYKLHADVSRSAVNDSFATPAISVDLLDLQAQRTKDRLNLLLGALIGIVGALVVEIILSLSKRD